jgi:hypothetical protein
LRKRAINPLASELKPRRPSSGSGEAVCGSPLAFADLSWSLVAAALVWSEVLWLDEVALWSEVLGVVLAAELLEGVVELLELVADWSVAALPWPCGMVLLALVPPIVALFCEAGLLCEVAADWSAALGFEPEFGDAVVEVAAVWSPV